MDTQKPLLEFPCIFPIKAMGLNVDDFESWVIAIVHRHAPQSAQSVARRLSSGGKYLSVTVTIVAESQDQLDRIYGEFSANRDRVLMAL
jgi:hypothetical protein